MVIDGAVGAWVLWCGWSGTQIGVRALGMRFVAILIALFLAISAHAWAAGYAMQGMDWTNRYAHGMCFLLLFGAGLLVSTMITAKSMHQARKTGPPIGGDRLGGGVVGLLNGAVLAYAAMCAFVIVAQDMAAKSDKFAIGFDKSKVGAFVLVANLADPEPFPHAMALLASLGDEGEFRSRNPYSLGRVVESPAFGFLREDRATVASIRAEEWALLRENPKVLALVCDGEFLKGAHDYMLPERDDRSEDPEERFRELREQRRELDSQRR